MKYLLTLCSILLLTTAAATAQNIDLEKEFIKNKSLFNDELYTGLTKKANAKTINKINAPLIKETMSQMIGGTYSYEYRVQEYRSYLQPRQVAKKLKTSAYSQFENPTGIFFEQDGEVVLFVDKVENDKLQLRITNFGEEGGNSTYPLRTGMNVIKPTNKGAGYIQYFTETENREPNVKIHIVGGQVNGVFDKNKHNNEDWVKLLSNAPSQILDIVGNKVHLAYSISSLKEFCPTDGLLLINLYDSIIAIQHRIMGLTKYNYAPDNHMFGRVIWKGFMHADGIGAAFHNNTMKDLADPDKISTNLWGIAHEFGHVNQVRPWMKWVGTTEVTNNIYSVWSQYLFDKNNPKLEREVLKDYDGKVAGGRITAYMESAFINKQQWLTQAGNDRWDRERPRDWGGDHFVKLVPLWQLQIYHTLAGEGNSWYQPDFYADIFIQAVKNEDMPKTDGEAQLSFIKKACDVTKTDLTDFFTRSGLLLPIDLWVDDYTCAQMTITEDDIANVKQYASQYDKPASPVMHYITANSIDAYKNKLAVQGQLNKGFETKENQLIIDHNAWKNAVAYETYEDDKLVKIAFAGAGSPDNKSTLVRLPDNATHVLAVAWDGTVSPVYRKN